MKKITSGDNINTRFLDQKDYLIIEEYDQHIDDKYVNNYGDRLNQQNITFEINDLIVRTLCVIGYTEDRVEIYFQDFKYYDYYSFNWSSGVVRSLRSGNSDVVFKDMIKNITDIFSKEMKIKIV